MNPDPTAFLSTSAATSAALVAIVGGLLVARFVTLDSDARRNKSARDAVSGRLEFARSREAAAKDKLVWWDAYDFLMASDILRAISEGVTSLVDLRRLERSDLGDDDLSPYLAEVIEDMQAARRAFTEHPPVGDDLSGTGLEGWDRYQRRVTSLPEIRWPRAWAFEFDAEVERNPPSMPPSSRTDLYATLSMVASQGGHTDHRQTQTLRRDGLQAEYERSRQRTEDLEAELTRLVDEHQDIGRPDGWLWLAVLVLTGLAAAGIAIPIGILSAGSATLAQVRWVGWAFAIALAALIGYIIAYLAALTGSSRKRRAG